jgi:hypothetical protein
MRQPGATRFGDVDAAGVYWLLMQRFAIKRGQKDDATVNLFSDEIRPRYLGTKLFILSHRQVV